MSEPAANYVSLDMHRQFRAQAWKVWLMTLAVVSLWLGVIVLAPVLAGYGFSDLTSPLYTFFSYICHQMPDRSLHLLEHQMAVCSRCFGVYAGLLAGTAAYPLWRGLDDVEPLRRFWLFVALIPISIDWSLTMFGIWENTHLSRFITGLILGATCATFIVPAIVEVVRNLKGRKRS